MAATPQTIELPLTLHISQQAREKLAQRAAAGGSDLAGYVSTLLEQTAKRPLSLEEISGPIYQRFLESGMTDDELGDLLEEEKHAARAERRARQAS
jgi:hypothetical protein